MCPLTCSAPQESFYKEAPYTKPALQAVAKADALSHHIPVGEFIAVIGCESQWNPFATSTTHDYGIAQWNEKAHPEITHDEADNPSYALEKAAEEWEKGGKGEWVCSHKLGYVK